MPRDLAPLIASIMVFMIPIVAILTKHQRKMAELMHQNHMQSLQPSAEAQALRQEVRELRELIHNQTIALDDLRSSLAGHQEGDMRARMRS